MLDVGFIATLSVLQALIMIAFIVFGEESRTPDKGYYDEMDFTKFMFTHLMIFVGFALLFAFIRRYSWTGIGQNFIIGVFTLEFYLIFRSMFKYFSLDNFEDHSFKILFGGDELFRGDFCAGAVLVSFGVLFGKVNTEQMIIMSLFETLFYALNEYLLADQLETIDVGGSLTLHAFGTYFGVLASLIYSPPSGRNHPLNATSYTSNIYTIVGALFLWVSWPCFNGALATEAEYTAVVNTYLSLLGSTVGAFIVTAMFNNGKLNMATIINGTLAGGIGIGSLCADLEYPAYAVLIGIISGICCSLAVERIQLAIENAIGLHDTCGIHNLHGIPGVLGSLFSMIYFGYTGDHSVTNQVYGLFCTVGLAAVTGALFGVFLKLTRHTVKGFYLDEDYWVECVSDEKKAKGEYADPLIGYMTNSNL